MKESNICICRDTYISLRIMINKKNKKKISKKNNLDKNKRTIAIKNTISFLFLLSNTYHKCQHYHDFIYIKRNILSNSIILNR
jgi:hypothetical protein